MKLSAKSPVVCNEETLNISQLHHISTRGVGRLVLSMLVLLALTILVVPAHAEPPTKINERGPFELHVSSDCTGEEVTITGEAQILGHAVEDSSGGSHVLAKVTLKGTGVSEAGTRFVFSLMGNVESNNFEYTGNGAIEATVHESGMLISNGSKSNEIVRVLAHVTANANGELTANVLQEEVKCVG
jgi:hypothetical protein